MVKTRPHLQPVLQYYHGPSPGPSSAPGLEAKLVPVFGPNPGSVIFLVPALVMVQVKVKYLKKKSRLMSNLISITC